MGPCLQFSVADIAELAANTEPTKRNVVSIIGKFYDPLGYLTPVIIRFKRLFQKLCQAQVKWDDGLPENLQGEWWKIYRRAVLSPSLGVTSKERSAPTYCVDSVTPQPLLMQQLCTL